MGRLIVHFYKHHSQSKVVKYIPKDCVGSDARSELVHFSAFYSLAHFPDSIMIVLR